MCACLHEEKKRPNVSVQTSTNVTRNPLAISMVTNKPAVQRLFGGREGMETDGERPKQETFRRRKGKGRTGDVQVLKKGRKQGHAEMMCSTINSVSLVF